MKFSTHLACYLLSLFIMVAAKNTTIKKDAAVTQKFILDQLRMIIASRQMKESLKYMTEVLQFSIKLQHMHDSALTTMECEMSEFNARMTAVSESYHSAIFKVTQLTDTNEQLKRQLADKNSTIRDLKKKLEEKTKENDLSVLKMEVMDSNLAEYQRRVPQLEQQAKQLSNKVKAQAMCMAMDKLPPHLHEIKEKVQTYNNSSDWRTLKNDLDDFLDHSSEAYTQLQGAVSLWDVGYKDYTSLAMLLLCAGLPVDMGDSSGDTMLHGAAWRGNVQLVEMLLDHGADVNISNNNGLTPIMLSAMFGHLEVVQRLVQAGADTTGMDKSGSTALDRAKNYGHTMVEQYLKNIQE